MTAALAVGENLAAAIVALMYAGGQYLESLRRAGGPARDDRAAVAGAAHRHAAPRRPAGGGRARSRSCPATGCWSGGATWCRSTARSPTGVAVLDQSALTGESLPVQQRSRRSGHERLDQCRRRLRSAGVAAGGRKHLCRRHPPGGGGAALARADVAAGRPLRHRIPGGDRGAGRARPGRSPATRCGRWPCWWWRRPVRSSWRCRWPSSPGCRARPSSAS